MLRLELECCLDWGLKGDQGDIQGVLLVWFMWLRRITLIFSVWKHSWQFLVGKALVYVEMLDLDRHVLVRVKLLDPVWRPCGVDAWYRLRGASEGYLRTRRVYSAVTVLILTELFSVSLLKQGRNLVVTRGSNRFCFELFLNLISMALNLTSVKVCVKIYIIFAQQLKTGQWIVVSKWQRLS